MKNAKTKEIEQADILRIESEINNLWGDLNTSNISRDKFIKLERELSGCEEKFKSALSGRDSIKDLESMLHNIDLALAQEVITHAENEIPKSERKLSDFQALENIKKELANGNLTPVRARHEVKEITRHKI